MICSLLVCALLLLSLTGEQAAVWRSERRSGLICRSCRSRQDQHTHYQHYLHQQQLQQHYQQQQQQQREHKARQEFDRVSRYSGLGPPKPVVPLQQQSVHPPHLQHQLQNPPPPPPPSKQQQQQHPPPPDDSLVCLACMVRCSSAAE